MTVAGRRTAFFLPLVMLALSAPARAASQPDGSPAPRYIIKTSTFAPTPWKAPANPLGDRASLEARVKEINKQIADVDARVRAHPSKDEFNQLQELRTNLGWERRALNDRIGMLDQLEKAGLAHGGGFNGPAAGPEPDTSLGDMFAPMPSTTTLGTGVERFVGNLPCVGCAGIDTDLTLYDAGRRYEMTETFQGVKSSTKTFHSDGLWVTIQGWQSDPNAIVLELNPNNGRRDNPGRHFIFTSADELTLLDIKPTDLKTPHNLTLKRVEVDKKP
ncbi:MAG: copper resistance protein NlpE N-terminal domain-containing protein [Elusimicrobia bacterium]|nr:copper resistance protein NlpE N-terminal domain-containing protein [Elusimicrobiota bacterium]